LDRWWETVDDPAVTRLIESALAGNFDLKTAWDRLDQARAIARREGADLYPYLDGTDSVSRSARESDPGGRTYSDEVSIGLAASYEVDLWKRVEAAHDAAGLQAQATAQDLRAAALSLSARVANTWYRLVEQQSQMALLQRQIETNLRYLELVELRFQKGDVSATDVLQQRKLVEATRTERARVQSDLQVLRNLLSTLTGDLPRQTEVHEESRLPELPPLPDTGVPAQWMRHRPDIHSAYLRVQASDRRLAAAIADRYPRFSLSAMARTAAGNPGQLFDEWLASVAGNITAPLVDGGRRRAEVDRNRAAASEALHDYGQTILNGMREVEDALTNERQQQKTVQGTRRQLALSNRTVEQLVRRYRNGTVNFLRVLDELRTQQQLQRNLLSTRGQLIRDRISLYRALGGGWELQRPEDVPADFVPKNN
jgi:NodT family efflux transporter outer membrane factor (OMF) lipoprotein